MRLPKGYKINRYGKDFVILKRYGDDYQIIKFIGVWDILKPSKD